MCGDTVVVCIRDVLICVNFTIKNCRGHCYDSASSMSGAKYGFATQVKAEEPRVILSNYYVHALQFSIGDMI